MSVVEKVRALRLPSDDYAVIGSGLLDAWGLRGSSDVDAVVSAKLFDELAEDSRFRIGSKHGDRFLECEDYEIFENWGAREEDSFAALLRESVVGDGVRFVSPHYLVKKKNARGWEKDLRDVELLKEKLGNDA